MHSKTKDSWGLVTLMIGGVILPVIGWMIGLSIVWRSHRWSTVQKVLGSLGFPVAMVTPALYFQATKQQDGSSSSVLALILFAIVSGAILWIYAWMWKSISVDGRRTHALK